MKLRLVMAIAFAALAPLLSAAEGIDSPELYAVQQHVFEVGSDVIRLDFDLNADGRVDQLITTTDLLNGKAGYIWSIYLQNEDGHYRRFGDPICFHPDGFYAGELAPMNDRVEALGVKREDHGTTVGLIHAWGGGGGHGVLLLTKIVGNKIEDVKLRDDYSPKFNETDAAFSKFLAEHAKKKAKLSRNPYTHYAPKVPFFTTVNRIDFISHKNLDVVAYRPDGEGGYTTDTMVMPLAKSDK